MIEMMKPIVRRFGLTSTREYPSDTELSQWHQEALQITMSELDMEIALVLGTTLPTKGQIDINEYLYRLCFEVAKDEFAKIWRNDPINHYRFIECSQLRQEDIDALARKAQQLSVTMPSELQEFEVDYERLEAMLHRYDEFNIPIYASNAAFELLVLAKRFDELQEIIDYLRKRYGVFLLGTHNAGLIIPMVEEAGVHVDGYLTPVNPDGIYMFPTQLHAVNAIRSAGKPVIAIKPLGGGRIPPKKAFQYLFHELEIDAAMVGVGSMQEAIETFGCAAEALAIK
jgi:hypothetical protein